jgi:hypothetical protein
MSQLDDPEPFYLFPSSSNGASASTEVHTSSEKKKKACATCYLCPISSLFIFNNPLKCKSYTELTAHTQTGCGL